MILIRHLFWIFYRLWFYIMVILPIIFLFPLLFISILKQRWYPFFFKLARLWAKFILVGMGLFWTIDKQESLQKGKSYMLIANHSSMIDIMLMLVCIKNPFVFVGKKELASIPLFGFFFKRTCIMVDRSSLESRKAVFLEAQKRLKLGLSICIFPEGGVPKSSVFLDCFKHGAFKLAIDHQIPIVPLSFLDNKKRFSYTFFSGIPGRVRAVIHPFIETNGLASSDFELLNKKARHIILTSLKQQM